MNENKTCYTINENIYFKQKNNTLINKETNQKIVLSTTMSQILYILIDKKGNLVTASFFMEKIWGERNIIVTQNTFVQNVSSLRRALKKIGLPKDIIITEKGRGYIIPDTDSIKIVSCQELSPNEKDEGKENLSDIIISSSPHSNHRPKYSAKKLIYFILFIIFIATSFIIYFISPLWNEEDDSLHYNFIRTDNKCNIYLNSNSDVNFEKIIKLIEKKDHINCEVKKYIYISAFKGIPHYSLFSCNNPITRNTNCFSTVHYDYEDEDEKN